MKIAEEKKSSFSLPGDEVPRLRRLKKNLKLKSNTAVIRLALQELENKFDRATLRQQFAQASELVKQSNHQDMKELDSLAGEGLE